MLLVAVPGAFSARVMKIISWNTVLASLTLPWTKQIWNIVNAMFKTKRIRNAESDFKQSIN